MFRPTWLFTLALSTLAATGGLMAAINSPAPAEAYTDLRYKARKVLGLEKYWLPLPDATKVAGLVPIACPSVADTIVVVTGGQSNATNVIPTLHTAGPQVSVWFEGACYPAADPILGANNSSGSLWSLMGDKLATATGKPVLLINGGLGGTQYADWNDTRSGYLAALTRRIETARAAGYEIDLALWHQGESDALIERDRNVIRTELSTLSEKLLDAMPEAPLYMFQTTKCIGALRANGVEEVRAIQADVVQAHPRMVLGMNTDTLGNDYRWDTCHFNSQGRAEIVRQVVPALVGLLDGRIPDPPEPGPAAIEPGPADAMVSLSSSSG
ncbi:sialate O-acetylesterase [Frigidibacter sp. MR17.24]|uniref:sialate O-acetylesterase n=1 Tax=Frigidibacter sp. MR17.24 TaxID=3127345 RepID=UPI003012E5EF